MTEQKRIFDKNIERVESICNLYSALKDAKQKDSKEYTMTDMLRAAVVLLHSSFEEYFRNTLILWLPQKADDNYLKEIPIITKAGKRAEKLFLNDLAKLSGHSIDDVIQLSVSEHIQRTTFNDRAEIKKWTDRIQIDLSSLSEDILKTVDTAVHRRHKIVHEADTNRDKNNVDRITGITDTTVIGWIDAYIKLVEHIDKQVYEWSNEYGQTNS